MPAHHVWTLNDRYRSRFDGSPLPDVPTWPELAERSNMEALLALPREGKVQQEGMIQQGELLHLLGRFNEAIAVLKAVPSDGHSEVRAVKIERLAWGGDTQLRELSQRLGEVKFRSNAGVGECHMIPGHSPKTGAPKLCGN